MNATVLKLVLLFLGALAPQTESKPQQHLDIPNGMKHYFVGLLVRGETSAQNLPKEELDQLMQKHLAYIRSQAEAGKYALAGPFLDSGRIAGMLIINAASAEEAKQIVSGESHGSQRKTVARDSSCDARRPFLRAHGIREERR